VPAKNGRADGPFFLSSPRLASVTDLDPSFSSHHNQKSSRRCRLLPDIGQLGRLCKQRKQPRHIRNSSGRWWWARRARQLWTCPSASGFASPTTKGRGRFDYREKSTFLCALQGSRMLLLWAWCCNLSASPPPHKTHVSPSRGNVPRRCGVDDFPCWAQGKWLRKGWGRIHRGITEHSFKRGLGNFPGQDDPRGLGHNPGRYPTNRTEPKYLHIKLPTVNPIQRTSRISSEFYDFHPDLFGNSGRSAMKP
jgi:hypothetical protein